MPDTTMNKHRTRTVFILSMCMFIVFTSILSLIPMLPAISYDLNVSKTMLGVIMGSFMIFMAFPQIPIGVLSDRYGRRLFITIGILIFSLGLLIFGTAVSGLQLLAARSLSGLGAAMFFSTAYTVVNDIYSTNERGKGMGIISITVGLGTVSGYILGGVIGSIFGWRTVFLSMFCTSLLLSVSTLWLMETSPRTREHDFGIKKMISTTLIMFTDRTILLSSLISMLCAIAVIGASFSFSFFASGFVPSVQMGFMFIPYALTSSLGASLTGFISDKVGRKLPLIAMIILGGSALMLFSHVTPSPLMMAINFGFVGLCLGPVVTLTTIILADEVVRKDERILGTSISTLNMVRWMGGAFGPVIAGSIMEFTGVRMSFTVLGMFILLSAIMSIFIHETAR